jgi:hypothetical protein
MSAMRVRAILPLAVMLGLGAAGCTNGVTGNVGDWVDTVTGLIPDTKKKLPGERKEVFPEGVPGVSQGVPPEMVKGYQPPETAAPPGPEATAAPAAPPRKGKAKTGAPQSIAPEEESRHANAGEAEKPKPKPKKNLAAKPPAPAATPAAPAQKPANQGAWPGVSPAQSGAAPWPAPQSQTTQPTAAWPAPPQPQPAWPDPRQAPQQPAQ